MAGLKLLPFAGAPAAFVLAHRMLGPAAGEVGSGAASVNATCVVEELPTVTLKLL